MKKVDFSETIAARDLKVGRCRQLIEFMKVFEYMRSRSFLYHIRGLSQKFVDNMDNFVQARGKSILRLPLFCPLY